MIAQPVLTIGHSAHGACHTDPLHQHQEIELIFVENGEFKGIFVEKEFLIPKGHITVFWGGFPHKMINLSTSGSYFWLKIPLEIFLTWRFPEGFKNSLLSGHVMIEKETERHRLDCQLLYHWLNDFQNGFSVHWALLEVEARLGRLTESMYLHTIEKRSLHFPHTPDASSAARMAFYLNQHYCEPVYWKDLAKHVGMSLLSTRRCFNQYYGMTLHQYLLQLRVARAKQLITNDKAKIIDIAMETGFPSLSNFYRIFEAMVGMTPSAYRRHCCRV